MQVPSSSTADPTVLSSPPSHTWHVSLCTTFWKEPHTVVCLFLPQKPFNQKSPSLPQLTEQKSCQDDSRGKASEHRTDPRVTTEDYTQPRFPCLQVGKGKENKQGDCQRQLQAEQEKSKTYGPQQIPGKKSDTQKREQLKNQNTWWFDLGDKAHGPAHPISALDGS